MIRDESIKAIEDALARLVTEATDAGFRAEWDDARALAEGLHDHPTLAADLDLATAWRMAQAECERLGLEGPFLGPWDAPQGGWEAESFAQDNRAVRGHGPDETDALVALTAALRERQP